MKSMMLTEIAPDALLMALWRRRPKKPIIIHSNQVSQFGSVDLLAGVKSINVFQA